MVKRIILTDYQLADSFPYLIEDKYGPTFASQFETDVARFKQNNLPTDYLISNLPSQLDFKPGTSYMNQVISYERIVFYSMI